MLKFLCNIANKEQRSCPLEQRFSRKQQAIADREQELLRIALDIVESEGYGNLTMDKLTSASPYSKGTIYNHFSSKEDVITALCNQALRHEISLFKKAALFNGTTRKGAGVTSGLFIVSPDATDLIQLCVDGEIALGVRKKFCGTFSDTTRTGG